MKQRKCCTLWTRISLVAGLVLALFLGSLVEVALWAAVYVEAATGIIMFGWTTGLIFAFVHRVARLDLREEA